MKNKRYSRGEELSNTLSHGAGTLLGITAGYFLLEKALANPHPYWATGCVLAYLVGMLASYISSTYSITAPGPASGKNFCANLTTAPFTCT